MDQLKGFLWRGKLRKAATILIGGFVVLVIISGVVGAFQEEGKGSPPASEPEATSTKVDTPEPTSLPELTAEECDYLAEVAEWYITPLYNSLLRLMDHVSLAASDPTLIFEDWWLSVAAAELELWSRLRDLLALMTPPPDLVAVHTNFLAASTRLDNSGTLIAQGVDEFDPDKINRATVQMIEATALLNEGNDLLTLFSSQHSSGC